MLPKNRRLTSHDIESVFSGGKGVFGEDLSLAYVKKNNNKESRFAVSIPSRIVKTAVKRNYLRRVCYNNIGDLLGNIRKSFFCVFVVKKNITKVSSGAVKEKIQNLLQKAGIMDI